MGLQGFRDSKQSWLIYIVFAFIIIVFIFMFGAPSTEMFGATNNATIAKINAHEIDYDQMRNIILRHYDDRIFHEEALIPTTRQMTSNLALIYLLADDARANGLRVSDDDWDTYMTNWEAGNEDVRGFLDRGNNFSPDRFQNVIRGQGYSPRAYREYKENELLARRYLAIMENSIFVSEESAWNMFAEMSLMASIEVIKLSPMAVKKTIVPVTESDIDAYLATNLVDVQKYYDEHIGLYTTPEQLKLQQITIQTDYSKLTNVGAKTVKTLTSKERYTIARHQVVDVKLDFNQAYADYDEAQTKTENGVTELLSIDSLSPEYAALFNGVGVGEIASGELKDRYVIAKVLERIDEVVAPIDTVKRDIARKLLEDSRIEAKTNMATAAILEKLKSGASLQEALDQSLYSDILAEVPKPVVAVAEPEPTTDDATADAASNTDATADAASNTDATADTADDTAQIAANAPQQNAIVVPTSERIQVITLPRAKIGASTFDIFTSMLSGSASYALSIDGIGESDELVRDIRNADAGTTLNKAYVVNGNTFFVRVVSKPEPDRATFDTQKDQIVQFLKQLKTVQLIGNVEDILNLRTSASSPRGLWLEQRLRQAEVSQEFVINEKFFDNKAREIAASKARQQKDN
ncbi:MAG: peptidyl-prolyl cis-trans isomerase [Proteobacteria bacterium]|nr:peptidyl-prolyl cis-trans isomerase [Pseudomonadota bacterium]